jgi:hypothetical protein
MIGRGRSTLVAIMLVAGLVSAGTARADVVANLRGRVRQALANQRLQFVGRSLNRIGTRVSAWEEAGRQDSFSTGLVGGSRLLHAVRDQVHRTGRAVGSDWTIAAYRDASPVVRSSFRESLTAGRKSILRLTGAGYVGGEMNDLFAASDDGKKRAGLSGFNKFLRAHGLGGIYDESRHVGSVSVSIFGIGSEAYRLRFDNLEASPIRP